MSVVKASRLKNSFPFRNYTKTANYLKGNRVAPVVFIAARKLHGKTKSSKSRC